MVNSYEIKIIVLFLTIGAVIVMLKQTWVWQSQAAAAANSHHFSSASLFTKKSSLPSRPPYSNAVPNDAFQYTVDRSCSMPLCFQYRACFPLWNNSSSSSGEFKVFIYPDPTDPGVQQMSPMYAKILSALRASPYATDNPAQACVFIPSLDTLDRDPLSSNFNAYAHQYLHQLPHWRLHGQNHLLFNMYAGTWPNYFEHEMGLPVEQAILVKSSFSAANMRSGFDISLPLFHNQHDLFTRPNASSPATSYAVDEQRPILLSFKVRVRRRKRREPSQKEQEWALGEFFDPCTQGKRYVRGVGSVSRNALFHLHNGDDVIVLTTCRHGSDWMRYADSRCSQDNDNYDTLDYVDLMQNSTFCLVPRGRRLGSYRFLESLKYGCIPVLLSNDWELPFSDLIDWPKAVVWADEHSLLQVSDNVRLISAEQIHNYRKEGHRLWNQYFSSIDRIVHTVLEIIKQRIINAPGLEALQPEAAQFWKGDKSNKYSAFPCDYPLRAEFCLNSHRSGFSIVLPLLNQHSNMELSQLLQIVRPFQSFCPTAVPQRIILLSTTSHCLVLSNSVSSLLTCGSIQVPVHCFPAPPPPPSPVQQNNLEWLHVVPGSSPLVLLTLLGSSPLEEDSTVIKVSQEDEEAPEQALQLWLKNPAQLYSVRMPLANEHHLITNTTTTAFVTAVLCHRYYLSKENAHPAVNAVLQRMHQHPNKGGSKPTIESD